MGGGFSTSGDSDEICDESIEILRKNDPELHRRLMAQVSRDLEVETSANPGAFKPIVENVQHLLSVRDAAADEPDAGPTQPDVQLSDYAFPFENLIFEGGGGKGRIYFGALKCLQEAGIKGKRFAGASAGAIIATLLALDLPLDIVRKYMSLDLTNILNDHSCGYLSILPNLLRYFGWNRGERFFDYFGQILEEHAANKDITFEQLFRQFGNELCVVAVNTNLKSVEYFHVKTTPHMTVRLAVRMSMSIPGWWLSLKPEDSFYRRLRPLSDIPRLMDKQERFGTFNKKTLGFLVYATCEDEVHQVELEKRSAKIQVPRPDTPLFRKWQAKARDKRMPLLAHAALSWATDKFFEALRDADLANDGDSKISKAEFHSVFNNLKETADNAQGKFTKTDAALLFGKGYNVDKIFKSLDLDGDGVISYAEMSAMLDKSLCWNRRLLGYARRDISSLHHFGKVLLSALLMHSMTFYMTGKDLDRTIGLNTDYVGTMDFTLDEADIEFLTKRGYETTKAFLLKYAKMHSLEKRSVQTGRHRC